MSDSKSGLVRLRSLLAILAGAAILPFVGCALMLEPIERRYLFQPWSSDSRQLASIASRQKGIEEVRLKTPDGVTLYGWLKYPTVAPAGARFPLVIVFGGVRREISWMVDRGDKPERWGWLFINCRGFGSSEGEPSERIVLQDVELIYDYAAARPDVNAAHIVLFGRSLGTYFAVALAKTRKVCGVILATPFDSIAALGVERYPWLPVKLLIDGRYDSAAIRPRSKFPRFLSSPTATTLLPSRTGRRLRAHGAGRSAR